MISMAGAIEPYHDGNLEHLVSAHGVFHLKHRLYDNALSCA
jgi:hypothetical protein